MAYPDLSDLRQRVRDLLNEQGVGLYSNAQLNRFINDGERDVAVKSLCLEREYSLVTSNGVRYASPVTCVKVMGVEYLSSSGSRVGLGKIHPRMVGHVNVPDTAPRYWFPWGDKVCIEPIPNASYSLVAYVAVLPTCEMTLDADEPQIPSAFIPWIQRCAYIHSLIRGGRYASAVTEYQVYFNAMMLARNNTLLKYGNARGELDLPDLVEPIRQGGA
jgi:hypothetical protein